MLSAVNAICDGCCCRFRDYFAAFEASYLTSFHGRLLGLIIEICRYSDDCISNLPANALFCHPLHLLEDFGRDLLREDLAILINLGSQHGAVPLTLNDVVVHKRAILLYIGIAESLSNQALCVAEVAFWI